MPSVAHPRTILQLTHRTCHSFARHRILWCLQRALVRLFWRCLRPRPVPRTADGTAFQLRHRPAMTMKFFADRKQLIGSIAVALGIVVCGGIGILRVLSGTLNGIEQVDRVNSTLAELSHYVADRHAWI